MGVLPRGDGSISDDGAPHWSSKSSHFRLGLQLIEASLIPGRTGLKGHVDGSTQNRIARVLPETSLGRGGELKFRQVNGVGEFGGGAKWCDQQAPLHLFSISDANRGLQPLGAGCGLFDQPRGSTLGGLKSKHHESSGVDRTRQPVASFVLRQQNGFDFLNGFWGQPAGQSIRGAIVLDGIVRIRLAQ